VNEVFEDRVLSRRILFSKDDTRFKTTGLDYVLPNPRKKK
jgi:hypothetical protein